MFADRCRAVRIVGGWRRSLLFFVFCGGVLFGGTRTQAQSVRTETRPKARPASALDSDVAQWATLKNIYGWEIKYPNGWDATGQGDVDHSGDTSAQTGFAVKITGPGSCSTESERCAIIAITAMDQAHSGMSPKEYLGLHPSSQLFASPRKFVLSGEQAMEACWPTGGHAPVCVIAVEHMNQIFDIHYTEFGKDNAEMKSPKDWKYEATFNKMLKTFSFYKIPETLWPQE